MNTTTISALEVFPDQLEHFFNAFPESTWHWSPESWEGVS